MRGWLSYDTSLLFRLGFWDAMGVGVATAFGLRNVTAWLESQPIPDMVPFPGLLGPPLIFVSLAIGAVGLGVWRGTFAALMRGETPHEASRLGIGLALGFLVGEILYDGFLRYFTSFGESATMSSVFLLLWAMLLVGILVLFFKGVEVGAATWLPVSLRSRSPRWAYRIGLTLASGSLALWFGPLLYFVGFFQFWLPLSSNTEESIDLAGLLALKLFGFFITKIPLSFLGFICLLAFPLAAWFWRGRIASASISNWPFLGAPPPQLTPPPPVPLRPGLALTLGSAGGLIFVVLSPFDIQVPLELVEALFKNPAPQQNLWVNCGSGRAPRV